VFGVLLLALPALGARYVQLMRDSRGKAILMAEKQERMVIPVPARPGSVFAQTYSRYVLLAGSKPVPSVYADPYMLKDNEIAEASIRAGKALQENPMRIQEALVLRRDLRFTRIKNGITQEQLEAFRTAHVPGMGILYDWEREYPNGALASQVLGYRRPDGRPGAGLELSQDRSLAARDGRRVVLADARRRPIWPLPDQDKLPQDGKNVFLCIDLNIQGFLEQAVTEAVEKFRGPRTWATGLVVNINTGEVLAMFSCPTFDPREYNRLGPDARANRAIIMPFEPGSALKPVFAASAVEAGVVTYQTQIFCENGEYVAHNGGRITDHGSHYGWLTVADGVEKSSNILHAKLGEKLGNRAMYEIAHRLGLGERTCIELPGESPGIIRPLRRWDGYSLRRVPFGQEISVTALQLTMAFCALTNGGELLQPRIIDHITDVNGKEVYRGQRTVVRRAISPMVSAQTLAVLQGVVERGTGTSARSDRWAFFGKTGTGQIPGPRGYIDGAYVSTFIGGGPVEKPELMCLISVYWPDRSKGYYGGKVAAPYVKQVLEKSLAYLNVPPDRRTGEVWTDRGSPAARPASGW
jgi:cell division protein FtsI/penicillin-binding protein 2